MHKVNVNAFLLFISLILLVWIPAFQEWYYVLTLRANDLYFLRKSQLMKYKYAHNAKYNIGRHLKMASHTFAIDNNIDGKSFGLNSFKKQNATFVMLARNSDLDDAVEAIKSLEARFNYRYHYDWTFFNDLPFDEEFLRRTSEVASGKTQYGLIPTEHWSVPSWINKTTMANNMEIFDEEDILYGSSVSYRNMCRYNSGFFFRQELLKDYDYYMRVDPDVRYHCDFPYDPFEIMKLNNKRYGFVISLYEFGSTIPTLWATVKRFIDQHSGLINKNNMLGFLTDKSDIGKNKFQAHFHDEYNLCHFWTNFEVADLNFFRSQEYLKFFDFLDSTGGFFYERWGDAPVHTIAASLLLDKDEIIHFEEIGYYHIPLYQCPKSNAFYTSHSCSCPRNGSYNIMNSESSCLTRYWKHNGKTFIKDPGYF